MLRLSNGLCNGFGCCSADWYFSELSDEEMSSSDFFDDIQFTDTDDELEPFQSAPLAALLSP